MRRFAVVGQVGPTQPTVGRYPFIRYSRFASQSCEIIPIIVTFDLNHDWLDFEDMDAPNPLCIGSRSPTGGIGAVGSIRAVDLPSPLSNTTDDAMFELGSWPRRRRV